MSIPSNASFDSGTRVYPNGIFADTGEISGRYEIEEIVDSARLEGSRRAGRLLAEAKAETLRSTWGPIGDIDPNDLGGAGWGIVFHRDCSSEIKGALEPLLSIRREQAGHLYRCFEGSDGYLPGDSVSEWLARPPREVGIGVVDPAAGVPYYLLLVGSPEEIPFEFQYTLDVFWAVGRLHFEHIYEYEAYSTSVVLSEANALDRILGIFAPSHEGDSATRLFVETIASPLALGDTKRKPIGDKEGFLVRQLVREEATKEALTDLLHQPANRRPSLLFTGTHGLCFRPDDPRFDANQGALICQNWAGFGPLSREHWFGALDVPSCAALTGMIHLCFACYGAGCPEFDTFGKPGQKKRRIALRTQVSRFPQALLGHPKGGVLAFIGHVDRAWSYSFLSDRGTAQVQGFRDVLSRIMGGNRVGHALDQFNVRWAALTVALDQSLYEVEIGKRSAKTLAFGQWIAMRDAKTYIVIGDPAAKLNLNRAL